MVLSGALKTELIKLDDMINLHEHLSEFSYGNGVTREVENLLVPIGLATPFYHQLSSLNDVHYRRRRKTCSRLDGYAFIHRESNPLGNCKWFQIVS